MSRDEIERWWSTLRPRARPTPRPALPAAELEARLRVLFAPWLPPGAEFALPPECKDYLEILGSNSWLKFADDGDFSLMSPAGILEETAYRLEDREPASIRGSGPWICLGVTGDHQIWYIFCDRSHPHFGHLMFGDDDDPWFWTNPSYGYKGISFAIWMEIVAGLRGPVVLDDE